MQKYLSQLLEDIHYAIENIPNPWVEKEVSFHDWLAPEEDERLAPKRLLKDWTGIKAEMLPPVDRLTKNEVTELLKALRELLSAYNCYFVTQFEVPDHVQYRTIRAMWDQEHALMRWHQNFFDFCVDGQIHGSCEMGEDYCHCAFFAQWFSQFEDDESCDEEDEEQFWEEQERRRQRRKWDDF